MTGPTTAPNLARGILATAGRRPDLVLGTIDDQVRLDDALAVAAARAQTLLDDGLAPGDPVALVATTSTDYVLTWLACVLAGLPVALVNPTYPDALTSDMLEPLAPQRVLHDVTVDRSVRSTSSGLPGLDADPLAVVGYMHTSGTTGRPKFCAQTHDYFNRLAAAMGGALDVGPGDRVLAPLPLFHINPMGYGVITALLRGADALALRAFSARAFWPMVVSEQITVLVLHAPPVEILKRATTGADAAGHRVRTMFYADADFSARFAVPAAVSGYGSTEAGGISHLHRWSPGSPIAPGASRHGGVARADIDWRLDEDGQIHLRERERAAMFDGYVGSGRALDPARDVDGWFATGDLGRDDGGELVFLERAAESIRVKGEFVPIPYLEGELGLIAGIEDLAVWKRPGELVDDELVLYAVAPELPVDALRDRIATLPGFMRPVAVARVDALPRDAAAGKVQRRRLPELTVEQWVTL